MFLVRVSLIYEYVCYSCANNEFSKYIMAVYFNGLKHFRLVVII